MAGVAEAPRNAVASGGSAPHACAGDSKAMEASRDSPKGSSPKEDSTNMGVKPTISKAEKRSGRSERTWAGQDLSLISGLIAGHLMRNEAHISASATAPAPGGAAFTAASIDGAETLAQAKSQIVVDHLAFSLAESALAAMST